MLSLEINKEQETNLLLERQKERVYSNMAKIERGDGRRRQLKLAKKLSMPHTTTDSKSPRLRQNWTPSDGEMQTQHFVVLSCVTKSCII